VKNLHVDNEIAHFYWETDLLDVFKLKKGPEFVNLDQWTRDLFSQKYKINSFFHILYLLYYILTYPNAVLPQRLVAPTGSRIRPPGTDSQCRRSLHLPRRPRKQASPLDLGHLRSHQWSPPNRRRYFRILGVQCVSPRDSQPSLYW
jgi:hypothetical protein